MKENTHTCGECRRFKPFIFWANRWICNCPVCSLPVEEDTLACRMIDLKKPDVRLKERTRAKNPQFEKIS